jgi:hypothetical protein
MCQAVCYVDALNEGVGCLFSHSTLNIIHSILQIKLLNPREIMCGIKIQTKICVIPSPFLVHLSTSKIS